MSYYACFYVGLGERGLEDARLRGLSNDRLAIPKNRDPVLERRIIVHRVSVRRIARTAATRGLLRTLLRSLGVSAPIVAVLVALFSLWVGYLPWQHPPAASAPRGAVYTLQGQIVRVADGDTVTLLVGHERYRIRLASIDAPETGHGKHRPGQPFGEASQHYLQGLVAGKNLTARCYEKDYYGREVCDLLLSEGPTANARLVAAGYAWANTMRKGIYLRDPALLQLERRAREARKGLWQDANPIAPWIWRQACWKQGKCAGAILE